MFAKRQKDLILGIVLLCFSGFYFYFGTQIKTRPKMTPVYAGAQVLPRLLGILLAILSMILIIQGIRSMRRKDSTAGEGGAKAAKTDMTAVALTFAMIVIYTLMLDLGVGFCLSTMIFLFLQILVLAPKQKRNYLLFAIVAVVFTMLVFVLFRIGLQQLLPRGPIESLLGY